MFAKEEGVNPVIAEILMILISVILVVSFYVFIVNGYISTPYFIDQLRGTLTINHEKSDYEKLYFTISLNSPQSIYPADVKITVEHGSSIVHLTYQGNFIWSNQTSGSWHYEAKLIDNDGDGKFSNGDTLIIYTVGTGAPPFKTGDKVLFSIEGYNGISSGGVVNF